MYLVKVLRERIGTDLLEAALAIRPECEFSLRRLAEKASERTNQD